MQLIPNANLMNPNVCQICEEAPDGDFVVDTERFTPFDSVFPLNGRKYVCGRCGTEIAKLLGFSSTNAVAEAQADADAARAELSNVRARTVELANHISDFVASPASVDAQASADAVATVLEQADSAAKAAVEKSSDSNASNGTDKKA